jgi:hypothetical protein
MVQKELNVKESVRIENKKSIWIFCILLFVQCSVIIAWATQKEGMHVDEIFTMEGVKQKGVSMCYWDLAEDFYGTEHTREEFLEHMRVNCDDLIVNDGIAQVMDSLLHGEFYYVLINLISSIHPRHIPWNICVGFNLLCFLVTQIILYLFARENFGDICALFTIAVYGFSAGAVSTVLYARCYMMLAMYVVLLIYVFHTFLKVEKPGQKIICIFGSAALAFCAYRTHQFGTILFIMITGMAVLYMLIKKRWNALTWLGVGYGIPCFLGYRVIWNKLKVFFTGGVASLFYGSVKNTPMSERISCIKTAIHTVADHMFGNTWIMLIIAMVFLFYFVRCKIWCKDSVLRNKIAVLGMAIIVVAYYLVAVLGEAIAWRYLSPVYPIIAMLLGVMISLLYTDGRMTINRRRIVIVAVVCIPFISYGSHHVSEMYAGKEARWEELEARYHGVNGIMVHHDLQGNGENWLYEAAMLWPQESNVMVIQNKMLYEDTLCYNRADNKILLWLTVDYDNEEVINRFRELTDYGDIELIMSTESLRIFECNK